MLHKYEHISLYIYIDSFVYTSTVSLNIADITNDNHFLFVKSQGFNVQLIFHLLTMYKQQFDLKVYEQGFQLHDKLSRVLSPKLAQHTFL